jgi:hypothetical protein
MITTVNFITFINELVLKLEDIFLKYYYKGQFNIYYMYMLISRKVDE